MTTEQKLLKISLIWKKKLLRGRLIILFNPLPHNCNTLANDKIIDRSKMKAFADNIIGMCNLLPDYTNY